jgi:hypothetical protein
LKCSASLATLKYESCVVRIDATSPHRQFNEGVFHQLSTDAPSNGRGAVARSHHVAAQRLSPIFTRCPTFRIHRSRVFLSILIRASRASFPQKISTAMHFGFMALFWSRASPERIPNRRAV